MKKTLLLIATVFCVIIANAQDIINYFEVGKNIATPVTIHTSKGKFTINGGERIDGNLYSITAYDANGNKIVQNTPYKTETGTGKSTIRYYRFSSTYGSSSSSSNDDSYRYSSGSGSRSSSIAENLGNYAQRASRYYMEGYSNLQIRAGYSILATESLSLKIQLGGIGGYNLVGGVGKNIFSEDKEYKMFYGGVGYYSGDTYNDISFNVLFGVTDEFFLSGELEYSYYFDAVPRLGLFIGGRLGAYFNYSFMLDLNAGITWKLFSN